MNQHLTIGAEIVEPATQLAAEAPLIRAHHEWFNGSGYPDGMEALLIPVGARILTIADAYEAMTSSRPYRKTPLTHAQAVEQLERFIGIQFDPEIVPVLVNLDRSILDRPPDRPDELPTMFYTSDQRAMPARARPARQSGCGCRIGPEEGAIREACPPRTMFLSVIVLALVVGALAGGGFPRLADLKLR